MKFKIGELVQLSAAGYKANQNWRFREEHGEAVAYGIVMSYSSRHSFPITCFWFGGQATSNGEKATFKTYELKRKK